jgi:hypothetical protein
MIRSHVKSRQPARAAWSRDHLLRERAIALGLAIDTSTLKNYGSALNSYLTFVRLHDFPVEPTPDTLSFFTVFMSSHIDPKSVSVYLSGICSQLEPYFQYCDINPLSVFADYLSSRDRLHPLSTPLWLKKNGTVPTRQFFISRLRRYFDKDVAGQSMRAGGATSLAEHGVPPSLIQFMGRWSSDAFFIYIRKSPVLIQALLYSSQN